MQNNASFRYVPVDHHQLHGGHFLGGIESFHADGGFDNEKTKHDTLAELRKEFYSTGDAPFKSNVCASNVFV